MDALSDIRRALSHFVAWSGATSPASMIDRSRCGPRGPGGDLTGGMRAAPAGTLLTGESLATESFRKKPATCLGDYRGFVISSTTLCATSRSLRCDFWDKLTRISNAWSASHCRAPIKIPLACSMVALDCIASAS